MRKSKGKGVDLSMHPFLGGHAWCSTVVGEGVGRSARGLGEGVHGCLAPDGRLRPAWVVRSVCATTWHGCVGDSGECPPGVQVCTKVNEGWNRMS